MREAASTSELEHHANGSLAADRATHRQTLSEVPDKERYPGHQLWVMSGDDNLTSHKLSVSKPWQSGGH